jgi:hypothetical protein
MLLMQEQATSVGQKWKVVEFSSEFWYPINLTIICVPFDIM